MHVNFARNSNSEPWETIFYNSQDPCSIKFIQIVPGERSIIAIDSFNRIAILELKAEEKEIK